MSQTEKEQAVPTITPAQPKWNPKEKMHALIWHKKQEIQYVERPKPMITDTTDILLKVTATTICGSDLHLYSAGMPGMEDGDILGHEFMGIIEEVGSDVKNLQIGQRVVVAFDIACGKCDYCKREEYSLCDNTNPSKKIESMYGHRLSAMYGYSHLTGGVPGGQAEYVRVPLADMNCLPLPDDVSDEKALYLSDVVPTAYHGTEIAHVKQGCSVGIWGLGPVGLMTAKWCQLKKAGRIIGIDCVPERLNMAKSMGIDVIDFSKQDVVDTIRKLVPGGLDCGIDCCGFEGTKSVQHKVEMALQLETDSSDIINEMFTAVRKAGHIGLIGVYAGWANHFPVGAMMEKALYINGGQSFTQKYWKMCLEKIRSGELDPTFIITTRAKLSDGPELYRRFYERDTGIIKVFLRPGTHQTAP
jgi:threonine dehydrogenase-like Zn-dependent dehydrogenase